ncbi:hypothetical protein C8F04DRAFT_1231317 [Mycena alexandri]|uniref:Uncharacterized protein n=1 Tax=Mycena alexandri TaxID=1745969 RepID=A0AAD6T5B1_9AGAR|nr:hypothetical protein C8F04DRAFT_1231317 [Mycena alexandri]
MLTADDKSLLSKEYPSHPILDYFKNKSQYDQEYKEYRERSKSKKLKNPASANKAKPSTQQALVSKRKGQSVLNKFFTTSPHLIFKPLPGTRAPFKIDPENWHLLPDSGSPYLFDTKLYVVGTQKRGTSWTFFNLPVILGNKPDSRLVWNKLDDTVRDSRTIEYVKTKTKGWTVGWADFCGHAQGFKLRRTKFMALCHWDPGLTPEQRQIVESHKQKRGLYDIGMRKLPKALIQPERNWRAATIKRGYKELEETDSEEKKPAIVETHKLLRIERKREKAPDFHNKRPLASPETPLVPNLFNACGTAN